MSGGATSEMRVQASSASGHTSTLQAARHMRAAEQLSRAPAGTDKEKQIYLFGSIFISLRSLSARQKKIIVSWKHSAFKEIYTVDNWKINISTSLILTNPNPILSRVKKDPIRNV